MQIYYAIIGACWLVFLATWAISALVFGGGGRRSSSPASIVFRLLILVAIFFAVRFDLRPSSQALSGLGPGLAAVGAIVCVAGLSFAIWARVALGRNWGMPMTRHEDPELVTSGPYRYVRHPIYTGLSTMFIGTSLVYPLAALPSAAMIAYCVVSALREEHDMAAQFPAAYPEYKQRSKMLVPFLF